VLWWSLFKNYVFSSRAGAVVRTIGLISVLGIAVGVMSLIIVTSVMAGFNNSFSERLFNVEPHLILSLPEGQFNSPEDFLKEVDYQLRVLGGFEVEEIFVFVAQDLIVRTLDGVFGGAIAKGSESGVLNRLRERVARLDAGKSQGEVPQAELQLATSSLEPGEIIMGIDLARTLGVFEGDEVLLIPPESLLLAAGEVPKFEKVKVRSLIFTRLVDFDQKFILFNRGQSLQGMSRSPAREEGIEVRFADPHIASKAQEFLKTRKIESQTWVERNRTMFFALKVEKFAMTTFLSLSVLITGFSIISVLILLVQQKRKDLGVLMAMGLSPSRARNAFSMIGVCLSSCGILLGAVLGVGICLILERYPLEILPDIYYDVSIPAVVDWSSVARILASAFVLAGLGSWLPVYSVSKLFPAEALKGHRAGEN